MKIFAVKSLLGRFGLDGFLLAIFCAVLLAYFFPSLGLAQKPVSLEEITNYGVSGIFFFYGLKLSPEKLKQGLSNWRMHLLVQSTTFLLFPCIALLVKPLFSAGSNEQLWLGIFYLASLPSTVSSAVVMVSMAGGNIPAAIFNASISSFIGIFMTPLWVSLFISSDTGHFDSSSIALKLALQVLLPVAVGLILNKYFGAFAEKHKKNLTKFDQTVIVTIIYTSFCKSFSMQLFKNFSVLQLFGLTLGLLGIFLAVMFLVKTICKWLKFNREDTIAVMFCGSKKSLVHGTVMSKVLFANSPLLGIVLLPVMLYHALQLVTTSMMAQKMARENES